MAVNKVVFGAVSIMDISDSTVTADKIAKGVTAYDKTGEKITGTMEASSAPTLQEKTVTPSTSAQSITADNGYDGLSKVTINAMPTATQATPSITISSAGKITASATQSAGYVAAGTKSATKQLTTQAAKTVTPTTSNQTAVASGRYTTGAVTVKGDANLVAGNIKSGTTIFGVTGSYAGSSPNLQSKSVTYTSNGTATITPDSGYNGLSSVDVTVNVSSGGGGGAGFSVAFPATAKNWNYVDTSAAHILLADGTIKSVSNYSTIGGKIIENVVGIWIHSVDSFFVLRMTLSVGRMAQLHMNIGAPSYVITTAPNATYTPYSSGRDLYWWPLEDTAISAIEMYNTD